MRLHFIHTNGNDTLAKIILRAPCLPDCCVWDIVSTTSYHEGVGFRPRRLVLCANFCDSSDVN